MIRAALISLALSTSPAFAQSIEDQILAQLQAQGFVEITMERTLLGRLRVVAINRKYRRELVIDPATGAILRDYWIDLLDDDDEDTVRVFIPDSGDDGDWDDEGDDDEDDEEDDEEEDEDDDDEDDDDEDDEDDEDDDDEY